MRYVDTAFYRAPFRPVPFAGLEGDPALGLPLVDVSNYMAPYRRGYFGPPVHYGYGPALNPWTAMGATAQPQQSQEGPCLGPSAAIGFLTISFALGLLVGAQAGVKLAEALRGK